MKNCAAGIRTAGAAWGQEGIMAIKGTRSIAEFKIREWMVEKEFIMDHFKLVMNGNEGILSDINGDEIHLVYDSVKGQVNVNE